MMMNENFMVEAEVHKAIGEGFRVKALILGLGQYINGMLVYPPNDKHDDWIVYTPTANRARIVEFNKESLLWKQIREACIAAARSYQGEESRHKNTYRTKDVVITDIDDGPIDFSSVPEFS